MKHLDGCGRPAALAFSAPAWAQPATSSGGSPMETPGSKASGTNYIQSHRHARAHHEVHGNMAQGPNLPAATPAPSTRPGRMPTRGKKVD